MFIPTLLLVSLVCLQGFSLTKADGELPECGVPMEAEPLDLSLGQSLDTIEPSGYSGSCTFSSSRKLIPKNIHWHIYEVGNDKVARIVMQPEGLVTPKIDGGRLKFGIAEDLAGWSKGRSVQAGVQLFIPSNQLKKVKVDGVDNVIEVIRFANNTNSGALEVVDSGVDNTVYVRSAAMPVRYKGTGVDSKAFIEAGSGSSIEISGVDNDVEIAAPRVSKISLTGVDQKVILEGDYDELRMTGVGGKVLVNGNEGCNEPIKNSGVNSKCRTTTEAVTIPVLECYADTTIGRRSSCVWGLSAGSAAGIGIGIFVLILISCIACCYCCFRCCGRSHRSRGLEFPVDHDAHLSKQAELPVVSTTPVVQAKVVETEDLSANTAGTYPQDKELYAARVV